jgi:hypothetical protein
MILFTLRLTLKKPTAEPAVAELYSRHKLPPPMQSSQGTWQTSISLADDRELFEPTFALNILFGFGVYP